MTNALATVLPNREVDDRDPRLKEMVKTYDSEETEVMVSVGPVRGWCQSCGTDDWGAPTVAFGVQGSPHVLIYHRTCLLSICRGEEVMDATCTLPVVRIQSTLAREANRPTRPWPVEPPSERAVRELLEPLFPGRFIAPPPVPAAPVASSDTPAANIVARAVEIALSGVGEMLSAPAGRAGDAQRGTAFLGAIAHMIGEIAAASPPDSDQRIAHTSTTPPPPDARDVVARLAQRLDAVERRLAVL